jgi:hypothetical protein
MDGWLIVWRGAKEKEEGREGNGDEHAGYGRVGECGCSAVLLEKECVNTEHTCICKAFGRESSPAI